MKMIIFLISRDLFWSNMIQKWFKIDAFFFKKEILFLLEFREKDIFIEENFFKIIQIFVTKIIFFETNLTLKIKSNFNMTAQQVFKIKIKNYSRYDSLF